MEEKKYEDTCMFQYFEQQYERFEKNGKKAVEGSLEEMKLFNTVRFWWCYYDKNTDELYDQFGYLCMENAYNYLLGLGLIDKYRNKIKEFS